ncbi:MAG: spermidine/putrescine ABC transporter substrate-binding protein [Candidatus Obscuribacterales bacterium]|nr:spermidine/putrescine ABC transporter substrate-binding protein [Candidatus Obscuribacterales bacterium]
MSISRRSFLQNSLATICGASVLSACSEVKNKVAHGDKQLNIYSWPDYLQPEAIPEFERRYGIKVVYDTVSSNEGLLAKLQAGASDYDIIVPSNYAVTKLKELKLLREIEKDRLSNYKYLLPRFQNSKFDPGCRYSIPYTFGTTGIAYNAAAPCYSSRNYPLDWDSFFDERIAGRMTLLEDARETIGFALKRRGDSVNTTDEKLIRRACEDLKAQKKYVMCYTSDQVIVCLSSGDSWLSLVYSGDAQQATRSNKDVKYIIPRSGASMWVDNLCIPKSAPHPEYAHLWINYMLEPTVAAALSDFTFYASPNLAARKLVSPELLAQPSLYPPDAVLDRCEEIGDVGSTLFLYDKLWTELKCV